MTSLRSVGDLLAVVPYLLGFHPTDSAVVLGVRDRKIIFQVRGDLPEPADVPGFAGYYADLVARQHAAGAVVLVPLRGSRVLPARGPPVRRRDQPARGRGDRRGRRGSAVPRGAGAAAGAGRR